MSSLQENSTTPLDVVNKRKTLFSRNDSFDKLQYTAFYTLQLAGTLLSQKSLLQIADKLQYESRVIFEKYVTLTIWQSFRNMCAAILFRIGAYTRYLGINVVFEKKCASNDNVEPEKTYILRVQKRETADMPTISSSAAAASASASAMPSTSLATEAKGNKSTEEKRIKHLAEFDAIQPHLRSMPLIKTWKTTDTDSEMGSNNSISTRQNIGMVVIVYGSATLVYIQLMFLAAFLQTAATPPGLLFLLFSLVYITYIVIKMGFVKTKKDETTTSNKLMRANPTEDVVGELPTKRSTRLSRTSTRRFLYFHNKTLSKIKLL